MAASLLLIPVVLCGLAVILAVPLLLRLFRRCSIEEVTPEWLETFSPTTYYPMAGLLSSEDFRFLARQPGFDASLCRKLRRERLHIFRQYLRQLIKDFNRLHTAARFLLAHNDVDRSDLVGRLVWLKIRFSLAVFQAQASYLLCCVGVGTLAVRATIARLEEMSAQLSFIFAAQAA